jgi:Uncharacterized protein containing TOPRIM domain, potential nuclease
MFKRIKNLFNHQSLKDELTAVRVLLEFYKSEALHFESLCSDIGTELHLVNKGLDDLIEQVEDLEWELDQSRTEIEDLESDLSASQDRLNELEDDYERLQQDYDELLYETD